MSPNFAPTGQFWRHGFYCVGSLLCRGFPTLTDQRQTTKKSALSNSHVAARQPKKKRTQRARRTTPRKGPPLVAASPAVPPPLWLLFVRLFVRLVGCCVISLPLVVVSHPVLLPCHVVTLHRISCHPSHCCRVIASLHRCTVTSLHSRVVASSLHRVIASSCRCVIVSSHHHVVASLHRRIVASRLASSLY